MEAEQLKIQKLTSEGFEILKPLVPGNSYGNQARAKNLRNKGYSTRTVGISVLYKNK